MKRIRGITVCAAVLSLAAAGWAEEEDKFSESKSKDFSIRVALGSAPGLSEVEDGPLKLDMDENTGGQLEILAVKRFWNKDHPAIGGVLGAGIFFAGNSGTETEITGWELDTGAFGFLGQAGVAGKIGERIVVEVLPYLGAGGAVTTVTFSDGSTDDGSGSYVMYGIKGGIFVLLTQSIELGVEIGYQGVSLDVAVEGQSDMELSGDGARGAVVLAVKF